LIHVSDLSWTKKVKHPSEFTQIGEEINVMVLEIDKDNRRLSLGHKQLEENPWEVFENIFTIDSTHEGTIIDVFDKGAIVALPYGVEGFVATKNMMKEDGTVAKVDEKLNFKVLEFNKLSTRIILSHSRTFEEPKKLEITPPAKQPAKQPRSQTEDTKMTAKKLQDSLEKTTLGDIAALSALKEEMEATANKKVSKKKPKAEDVETTENEIVVEQSETIEATEEQQFEVGAATEQPEVVEISEQTEVAEVVAEQQPEVAEVVEQQPEVAEVVEQQPEVAEVVEQQPEVETATEQPEVIEVAEQTEVAEVVAEQQPEVVEITEINAVEVEQPVETTIETDENKE